MLYFLDLPELGLPPLQISPVSDLHLNDLTDLLHLLVLQVLLHHKGLVPLGVDIAVPEQIQLEVQSNLVPLISHLFCCLSLSLAGMDLSINKTILAHCRIHSFFISAILA